MGVYVVIFTIPVAGGGRYSGFPELGGTSTVLRLVTELSLRYTSSTLPAFNLEIFNEES